MIKSFTLRCRTCNAESRFNFQVFKQYAVHDGGISCSCHKTPENDPYPLQKLFWTADKLRYLWRQFPGVGIKPKQGADIEKWIDNTLYIRSVQLRLKGDRITHTLYFSPYHHMDTGAPTTISHSGMTPLDDPVPFPRYSFEGHRNGLAPEELYLLESLVKAWNHEVYYLKMCTLFEMQQIETYGVPRKARTS